MQSGGIFLDKRDERVTGFGQLPLLSQLRRRLKLGEADVGRRRWRDFSTLLLFHCDLRFDESVVTKPSGTAEDDQCQQQHEEPFHGRQSAIVNPSEIRELLCAGKREALILPSNRRSITRRIVREESIAPVDQAR